MVERVGRQGDLPMAGLAIEAREAVILAFLPSVKVADEVDGRGVRCPLAEHPAVGRAVQAEVEVAGGEVREALPSVLRQVVFLLDHVVVSPFDGLGVRLEPRVFLNQHGFVHHFYVL